MKGCPVARMRASSSAVRRATASQVDAPGVVGKMIGSGVAAAVKRRTGRKPAVRVLNDTVATLLAGLYVPVHWFPDWLRTIAAATPFPSLIQTPVDILSGYAAGPAAVRAVAVQVGWVLALGLGASMATAAGRRRLEVQGG